MTNASFIQRSAQRIAEKIVALFDEDAADITKKCAARAMLWEAEQNGALNEVVHLLPDRGDIQSVMEDLEDRGEFHFF